MWHLKLSSRLVVALVVLALVSFRLPAQIDLAAEGQRASGADRGKASSDPCKEAPKSGQADRGDSDEEFDVSEAEDSATNDGADDEDTKGKNNGKHLRECEPPSSGGVARGDFNGDGIADLAVGVPFEDEDNVGSVGAVNIIYGSATGLTSTGDQYLTEVTFGYPYTFDDRFGAALASGDFNGDGFSDLAIGMPRRAAPFPFAGSAPDDVDHGAVLLIDGSVNGLVTSAAGPGDGPRTLNLIDNVGGLAGAALVWGDFNGDNFGDLVVGIPAADSGTGETDIGEVQVFFGGPNSLTQLGGQRFVGGNSHGLFGAPLAAGDFNRDGMSDLAVGSPLHDVRSAFFPISLADDIGAVGLFAGGTDGLTVSQALTQDVVGVADVAEAGDLFGFALAVGDFNGDALDDLAVGVPNEDLLSNTVADAGAVHIFFGRTGADELVDAADDLFFGQGSLANVAIEAGDRMGRALAAGKFNGDSYPDLAIGVPGEDIGSIADAGMVSVLYGSSGGPFLSNIQHWHQDSSGIPDSAEAGDEFGRALSAWNYGRSTHADLAIGVPFEDLLSVNTGTEQADAGAVVLIYGSATGLSATTANPSQFWHQDVSGIGSAASAGDRFGVTLY